MLSVVCLCRSSEESVEMFVCLCRSSEESVEMFVVVCADPSEERVEVFLKIF